MFCSLPPKMPAQNGYVEFRYSIQTPYKHYSNTDSIICNINLPEEDLVKLCEVEQRRKLNGLFDDEDCIWKVSVTGKVKIL